VDDARLLEDALSYATAGYPVVPLIGKRPNRNLARHGVLDATTDAAMLREWWRRCPSGNIGIRPPDGIVVADVDPRSGGTLEALGTIPVTWTARTGSGGWHVWFRHRFSGHPRGKLAGAPGIDIKTHHGYLVVAPSVHPDTGRRYEWVTDAPIAWLPAHLRPRVEYAESTQRQQVTVTVGRMAGLVRKVAESVPGNRNSVLFWSACRAFEQGAGPADLDLLLAAAVAAGLDTLEAERTIRSAERRSA
jgi:hypothetical protein